MNAPKRDSTKFLQNILEAINDIEEFTKGMESRI
jgi:uncharacterized protein with HEPN domain